jgi:hypothetical protein
MVVDACTCEVEAPLTLDPEMVYGNEYLKNIKLL